MEIINLAHATSHATNEPSALGFLLPIFILVLMYFILIALPFVAGGLCSFKTFCKNLFKSEVEIFLWRNS